MSEVVEVTFEEETTFAMEFSESGGGGGTTDHALLSNRDAADQHPIGAISGLEKQLENSMTDEDVSALMSLLQ